MFSAWLDEGACVARCLLSCCTPACPFLCTHSWAQCVCTALKSDGGKGVKATSTSREVVADFYSTCDLWGFFFLVKPDTVGSHRQCGQVCRCLSHYCAAESGVICT